jgi:hypothetical protein
VISLLIGALGLTGLALDVSLGVSGLVAFVLAWRGRLVASAWAMLVGGLLIWVVSMPTMGLASRASSQFLLTYPLLLAGLVLDRTALWGSAAVLILATAAGPGSTPNQGSVR